MNDRSRRPRVRHAAHVLMSASASVVVLAVLAFGYGPIPPLGAALDPGHGVWTSAADGAIPHSEILRIPGIRHPVSVYFTAQGIASIRAADEDDLYLAQGYVEASFRLAEMDLQRRLAEGRLAQLAGPSDVSSDEFELRLGLIRTAQEEWAQTPRGSAAGQELLAYSEGVNDYIAQARSSSTWPAIFSLTGVYPRAWTPVDSLAVQEATTQLLDFTTTPLDYALLERSLGAARTMAWFPIIAANQQIPYDPGPYTHSGVTPIAAGAASTGSMTTTPNVGTRSKPAAGPSVTSANLPSGAAAAAATLLAQVDKLPAGQLHQYPDSNAWAANGIAVSGGHSMLAGDPHLPQTLPSIWYQVALNAPGFSVSGVSIPGLPGIIIGHNDSIAWSLTDVQNQSTLFYAEQTSPSHPGEYYWRGRWRPMAHADYTIEVRGGSPVRLTVDITVHGPLMTQAGQTMAVDWMGNIPSSDVAVMAQVSNATDFAQFRAALVGWKAPTQNFVYADKDGNIGAISAGYYPQVAHGDPWLPLPGTGADDVIGVIPYNAIPQIYDPPGHVVATANQRPVGPSYPYYIGTSADFFDPGFRVDEIYSYLRGHSGMNMASYAALQTSADDWLAGRIVPHVLSVLRMDKTLDGAEQAAMQELARWNDHMDAGSPAAAIWATFWSDYESAVFQPWWKKARVPVADSRTELQASLNEDLEAWTLADPANPAFSLPSGTVRTSADVVKSAFAAAVAQLSAKFGGSARTWTWGRLHSISFPSITAAAGLGYGPRPAGGDQNAVNAADGYPVSSEGPSWRMIVTWTAAGQAIAEGIYPGGQSENPVSPWYANFIPEWWDGRYVPMPPAGGYTVGPIRWSLLPGGAG
jgi:penicillin G amidase